MKKYRANDELEKVLISKGFVETTIERNLKKRKKSFKLSHKPSMKILFDYSTIHILKSFHGQDSQTEITESELKALFLYYKLKPSDFKEVCYNRQFNFKESIKNLKSIKEEFEYLNEFNIKKPRRNKLKRILDTYNEINLN